MILYLPTATARTTRPRTRGGSMSSTSESRRAHVEMLVRTARVVAERAGVLMERSALLLRDAGVPRA